MWVVAPQHETIFTSKRKSKLHRLDVEQHRVKIHLAEIVHWLALELTGDLRIDVVATLHTLCHVRQNPTQMRLNQGQFGKAIQYAGEDHSHRGHGRVIGETKDRYETVIVHV